MGAAGCCSPSRVNALAEAAAPAAVRGRYLAAFQYSFTVPGVLAPAVVALFSVAVWLPWLVVGPRPGWPSWPCAGWPAACRPARVAAAGAPGEEAGPGRA